MLGLIGAFAIIFPLATGGSGQFTHRDKYVALVSLVFAIAGIMVFRLAESKQSKFIIRKARPGLMVAAVLGSYSLLLCGLNISTSLVVLLLPFIAVCFSCAFLDENRISRISLYALAGFTVMALASCFLSSHQYMAISGSTYLRTGLPTLLCCISLFFAGMLCVKDRQNGLLVLRLLALTGFPAAVIALLQFFIPNDVVGLYFRSLFDDPRPYGSLGHPNWFGTFVLLVLPLAAYFALTEKRWYWWFLVALLHASLLACQTRGAWLAEMVLMAFILISFRKAPKKIFGLFAILFLATLIMLPMQNGKILARANSLGNEANLAVIGSSGAGTGRFGFWKYGIEHVPRHMVLGAGFDQFAELGGDPQAAPTTKAHSIYLDLALSVGAVGLLGYLMFVGRTFWKHAPSGMEWVFRGLLIAYLIQGFFIHDTIQTWPLLWLLAGLVLGPLSNTPRAENVVIQERTVH